jgi:Cu(I)/Ag(I) efflux system membrane fusion protein
MNTKQIIFVASLLTALGLFLVACSKESTPSAGNSDVDHYTCSMHPSVNSQDPKGKCPICGMNLVPVPKGAGTNSPGQHNPPSQ